MDQDLRTPIDERGRRRLLAGVVTLFGVAGVALALVLQPPPDLASARTPVVGGTSLPPWPAPADPGVFERSAGLAVAPSEGLVQHFHVHLDLLVDGRAVPVPANLGIDVRRQIYSELHTHADSGVVHAEAADAATTFTLGQLFGEWNVRLDAANLGGLRARDGRQLWAFVDGVEVVGDPATIRLADHQEIVLAYGTDRPGDVPDSFDFDAHPV